MLLCQDDLVVRHLDPDTPVPVLPALLQRKGLRRLLQPSPRLAILLHPPLHLVGVSTDTERESQQNDSLADG